VTGEKWKRSVVIELSNSDALKIGDKVVLSLYSHTLLSYVLCSFVTYCLLRTGILGYIRLFNNNNNNNNNRFV